MLEKLPNRKFERKVTSAECFFARAPFTIVTMVARIKGNVSEEMLRNAVGKVQRRHVLLRVRIQYDQDHQPWFTSEGIQEIPIEVVPRGSENDWIRIHVQALKDPYAFETHPAIRFILVQSPDSSELIILCHHIICDGMSLAYLARDLMVHLGEPEREVEVLPAPPIIDLDNLPGDVAQSGLVKSLIKRMNQQWAEEGTTFDHEDYKILTKAYWDTYTHELFSIELSEAETSLLAARCREENVTVNAAITVSFSAAQSLVEGEKSYHSQLAIGANLRDRLPDPPGEGMGYYAGAVELKFKYNHKRGFWENARTFLKNFQKKYTNKNLFRNILNWLYLEPSMMEAFHFKKLGGLVPSDSPSYEKLSSFSKEEDVVFRILKRDKLESLERKHWGIAVTNLGRLDFPKTYGPLELDRLIMQPGGGIPLANVNMVIGAVTCSGKLCLVVEYTEQAIDPGAVGKIKEKAMEFLLNEPV